MCTCCRTVVDYLGHSNKGYTAYLRIPKLMKTRMEDGIDAVSEDLKKKPAVTPQMFHEALHKYLTRQYQDQKVFNYRNTRKYTVIRIENLDRQHWKVLETLLDRRKKRHPLKSAICHCDCPSDRWTLAYNIASMLPVVGGILTAAIGTHIILGCLTRAGMPDGKMGRVKWLLITAVIIEILALLVATSVLAPIVNQVLKPFERVAKMVEIHFLMVIYFRTHPGQAERIALELGIADVREFEDRMSGNSVEADGGKKKKGTKKKRKGEKTGDNAV